MKALKSVLLLISVVSTMLCLSGCFVQSYYPFYTEQAVQNNVMKFTNFMLTDKEGEELLDKPGINLGPYMILKSKNGESEQINTKFFKAGKTLFLDAQGFLNKKTTMFSNLHSVGTHVLYRVDLIKDRINLTRLSTKWFIDAAQNNRITLPNVIRKTGSVEEILFTAKSEEWIKFLEKNGENPDIYDESTVLTLKSVDSIAEKK